MNLDFGDVYNLLVCWLRFQKMVGLYYTFSQEIIMLGKQLKIVMYPKFTCITLFDVEVIFCCLPRNVTTFAIIIIMQLLCNFFVGTICFIRIRFLCIDNVFRYL